MLNLVKFLVASVFIVTLLLLGANYLQSADGTSTEVQAAASQVMFMAHRVTDQFPNSYASFSHSASVFVQTNATTARLQFEGMKNSVPGSLAFLQGWLPSSSNNLTPNGAKNAVATAAGQVSEAAKKIPAVNGALNAAGRHIDSLRQSAHGF